MLFETPIPVETIQIPEPAAISADLIAGVLGDYYQAEVARIIDGDTAVVNIILNGNLQLRNVHLRLVRIDADKLGTPAGNTAAAHLRSLIGGKTVVIKTFDDRTDKYGRTLAEIYLPDALTNVNSLMLDGGYAEPYPKGGETK